MTNKTKIIKTSLNLRDDTYKALRLQAILEDKTVSELLDDMIVEYLQKKRKEAMIA